MILLLTRIWPTPRRPSLGSFVRDRASGIPGIRVVHPRSMSEPWPVLYSRLFLDAMRVSGSIRGVEAHVVVPTGLVGWAVARLRRVPLVVYAHGGDVRELDAKPWPFRWLTTLVVRHADRVVTNSEDTASRIRAIGGDPSVAAPGTRLQRFGPTPRPGRRRVLYMGGANSRKGYDVARQLADTLVGPWLQDIDPSDVPPLIAEHDVVLIPSVAEPFGLAAVEAIASGRWVVAAAVGGLRDIVIDGVNGTLVADGDFRGALKSVPDYDPYEVARTADRWSLERWQEAMAMIWEDLIGPYTPIHPSELG
jgi:glycosyltransferase involved in cell wall biosynthesis